MSSYLKQKILLTEEDFVYRCKIILYMYMKCQDGFLELLSLLHKESVTEKSPVTPQYTPQWS